MFKIGDDVSSAVGDGKIHSFTVSHKPRVLFPDGSIKAIRADNLQRKDTPMNYKPFPPMRKDETTIVDYDLAMEINNSCQSMGERIEELEAALRKNNP